MPPWRLAEVQPHAFCKQAETPAVTPAACHRMGGATFETCHLRKEKRDAVLTVTLLCKLLLGVFASQCTKWILHVPSDGHPRVHLLAALVF